MNALLLWFGWLLLSPVLPSPATPVVRVQLGVAPTDTAATVTLHLDRRHQLLRVRAPGAERPRVTLAYYPYFADTLQQIVVHYKKGRARNVRRITLTYAGTLAKRCFTDEVNVFSAHSGWLPTRPYHEYDQVAYTLRVRTPAGYAVRSTTPARRRHAGQWTFRGTTSGLEITALVAPQFAELASSGSSPAVKVVKAGKTLTAADSAVLHQTETICAFYNRTLGRQDPVTHFSIFLPGTNADAFGLLANATIITYSDFDVNKPEDLLILAHEISHKWWGRGSVHTEDDWLNEAFATHSSLLYVRAAGDTATYRARLAQLTKSAAGTPAIIGFNRYQHEPAMYRRVIYNKGTVILAALCSRLGREKYVDLLAAVAGKRVETTAALLHVVQEVAGPDTRAWLLAQLSQ